ncbi:MAG TPA: YggT family protein [Methylomirabilota bacterium]|nr:YggT family protein [Methylomirabilota bacterium]
MILGIARLIELVITAYTFIIIARALISWVSPDPFNPIVRFLYRVTEPVLRPVRRRLPNIPLDLSPVVVIIVLQFLEWVLVGYLRDLALTMR